ncbi:MAG: flavin reductase [Acutalibacteraceae bacterium]|nr:flavin reductase [Bacillota bacterium]
MDTKAFRALSYGVYVITSQVEGRPVGCVANSVMQITSSPATVAVSMNRDNFTHSALASTGVFAVNVLGEQSNPSLIGRFGFSSSRDTDKFTGVSYEEKQGVPVLHDSCAFLLCRVIDRMETSTHTVFLSEVIDAGVFPPAIAGDPMTYAYYHKVIKGTSPKNAPTYLPEEGEKKPEAGKTSSVRWVCSVCGYVYEGDPLPDGFVCPLCSAPAEKFTRQVG